MINLRDVKIQILITSALLVMIGLAFIYTTGSVQSVRLGKNELYFFVKQFISVGIGFLLLVMAYNTPISVYRKNVMLIFFITLVLLVAVYFMPAINGARRWIVLPIYSFQPSELAKFTAVLYLAHYLDKKTTKMIDFAKGFLPATLLVGLLASLILFEPDLGTTVIIVTVSFSMLLAGGARLLHIFGMVGLVLPILMSMMLFGYRRGRILSFLDPWEDRFGVGYQLIQSLAAVGSGGPIGKGVGNSTQKLFFLPEAHTDFIFAIIAEETGMIGTSIITVLILFLFRVQLKAAFDHKDRFHRLLIFGLALTFFMQSFIHIFVVLGLLPTKGITLPFVSYGGSAIVFALFSIGVILRSIEEDEGRKD